jgi:cyclopropane fatty-acyl-phospholipid synthase-like methyltransferase
VDHRARDNVIIAYLGKADNLSQRRVPGSPLVVVEDPKKVDDAYARQYDNLAREFEALLPTSAFLAEVGCGMGQLTVPLAKLRRKYRFEVVDTFTGPYTGTLTRLKRALLRARLNHRVRVHKMDYLDWISDEFSGKYTGVISSEFLPEINSYELKTFLPECYRVLRRGGVTIHSFLSSSPRNRRQRLLIEADTRPVWTRTTPKEWFSPKPALVVSQLKHAGFRNVLAKRVKGNLVLRSNASRKLLESWDVKGSFWKEHRDRLEKDGLEIPDWVIISGSKS